VTTKWHSPKGKRSAAIPPSPLYFFALQKNSFEYSADIDCRDKIKSGSIFDIALVQDYYFSA
jgi:hypothetical protein